MKLTFRPLHQLPSGRIAWIILADDGGWNLLYTSWRGWSFSDGGELFPSFAHARRWAESNPMDATWRGRIGTPDGVPARNPDPAFTAYMEQPE